MTHFRRSPRILLAADAFLFAATLDLCVTALFGGIILLADVDMAHVGTTLGPAWGSAISLALSGVLLLGGAVVAWRLHHRSFSAGVFVTMLLGGVAGAAISMSLLVTGARLLRFVSPRGGDGPPWFSIAVLAVLVAAFLAVPVIDAVRDFAVRRRRHVTLDRLRIGALALGVALALVALPWMGARGDSEMGEAGVFVAPFAAAAAFAVVAADYWQIRREPRRPPVPPANGS